MLSDEAKALLGFPPDCRPSPSQVKAAYRTKVWETHPDRFPAHEKSYAEYKFKMISEAYTCLCSGARVLNPSQAGAYSYVVRTGGVPRGNGGRRNHMLVGVPFLLVILGTLALAGSNVASMTPRQLERTEGDGELGICREWSPLQGPIESIVGPRLTEKNSGRMLLTILFSLDQITHRKAAFQLQQRY